MIEATAPTDATRLFVERVRIGKHNQRIAAGAMCVLGVGGMLPRLLGTGTTSAHALYFMCGLLSFVIGLLTLADTARKSPALEVIQRSPESIVWFYVVVTNGSQYTLSFGLDNGKLLDVYLGTQPTVELEAMQAFARIAPHARQGYSAELRQAFYQDPRKLGRPPAQG